MGSPSAALRQEVSNPGHATTASDPITDTGVGASLVVRIAGESGASLNDFAEQFECLLNEKRDLTLRLSKALDENAALNQLLKQARAEIVNPQSQLSGGLQSLLAAKEKLIREEYERKFQELTVEVRQVRSRYNKLIEETKKRIASCICRAKAL
jgi:hypothetical protein